MILSGTRAGSPGISEKVAWVRAQNLACAAQKDKSDVNSYEDKSGMEITGRASPTGQLDIQS